MILGSTWIAGLTGMIVVLNGLCPSLRPVGREDPEGGTVITAGMERDGVKTTVTTREGSTRTALRPRPSRPGKTAARSETRYVVACDGNSLESWGAVVDCAYATAACAALGEAGLLAYRWRRRVATTVTGWRIVGTSCISPRALPGRPAVTIEQVRSAFARTPFKRPMLLVQPPGGRTLIRMPVFVEASFPGSGYGVGQAHAVTLLGRSVQIRVSSVWYIWDFGDGTPPLRSSSAGGPWPEGDVQHTYAQPGEYLIRLSAVYGGEFAVDGGRWTPVASTVTIPAPPTRLEVVTTRTYLLPD